MSESDEAATKERAALTHSSQRNVAEDDDDEDHTTQDVCAAPEERGTQRERERKQVKSHIYYFWSLCTPSKQTKHCIWFGGFGVLVSLLLLPLGFCDDHI